VDGANPGASHFLLSVFEPQVSKPLRSAEFWSRQSTFLKDEKQSAVDFEIVRAIQKAC
jgi:hypothetical protein